MEDVFYSSNIKKGLRKAMKRLTKVFKYVTLLVLIFLPILYITSYTGSFDEFAGLSHTVGCHSDAVVLSSGGSVELELEEEGDITGGSTFEVTAKVEGFSEAAGETIVLGFASGRGDNGDFEFEPGYKSTVSIDSSGDASEEEFSVTAPTSGGTFTIIVDALSSDDGVELNWTYGSLELTVIASSGGGVDIVLATVVGTIASVGALIVVATLTVKYTITRRRFFQEE